MLAARDAIEPVKALQQSGNHGQVPFAAPWRWYLSLVQLASDGLDGDKARFPKFTNCWAKGLSSHVSDPLDRQRHAPKRPPHSVAMPVATTGARNSSSVQFLRQLTLGNEACRHKLPNGREQIKRVGVCGSLDR